MSEADLKLVARRRSCSLLTRDEMVEGRVPTTATTSSVVAGIQAQEAIKLLHRDRLGNGASLRGAGYQFAGISHDSYVVNYQRRDECLAHDTYDLAPSEAESPHSTFTAVLSRAREVLGPKAVIDLEHDIALRAECGKCGEAREFLEPISSLKAGSGICPRCETEWRLEFAHTVAPGDTLAEFTPAQIGLPTADIVSARAGEKRLHYRLTGNESALECLRAGNGSTAVSAVS